MSKTLALRELIKSLLCPLCPAYYRRAKTNTAVPYLTFDLSRADLQDSTVDILDLCVDLYDRSEDPKAVDEIADKLEEMLNAANLPQPTILPTFFPTSRYPVEESDRSIQHLQLHFYVQLYTVEEE